MSINTNTLFLVLYTLYHCYIMSWYSNKTIVNGYRLSTSRNDANQRRKAKQGLEIELKISYTSALYTSISQHLFWSSSEVIANNNNYILLKTLPPCFCVIFLLSLIRYGFLGFTSGYGSVCSVALVYDVLVFVIFGGG